MFYYIRMTTPSTMLLNLFKSGGNPEDAAKKIVGGYVDAMMSELKEIKAGCACSKSGGAKKAKKPKAKKPKTKKK